MRPLLVYCCTGPALADFVRRTLPLQRGRYAEAWAHYGALLVIDDTDRDPRPETDIQVIRAPIVRRDGLCVSAGWNWGLDWAWRAGAERVIILGADGVIIGPPGEAPATGFGTCSIYACSPGGTGLEGPGAPGSGCHFIFTREVFSRYRYSTLYRDWGYEDLDLMICQLWADGIHQEPPSVPSLHLWHEQRAWKRESTRAANCLMYVRRRVQAALRVGHDPRVMPLSEEEERHRARALQLDGIA